MKGSGEGAPYFRKAPRKYAHFAKQMSGSKPAPAPSRPVKRARSDDDETDESAASAAAHGGKAEAEDEHAPMSAGVMAMMVTIQHLKAENERLGKENKRLDAENASLRDHEVHTVTYAGYRAYTFATFDQAKAFMLSVVDRPRPVCAVSIVQEIRKLTEARARADDPYVTSDCSWGETPPFAYFISKIRDDIPNILV